ncbi:MAG: phosphatase PAP2 family protein [Nitrospirota bacterium]|nr:phosphatase PAP2 family protein [Nitrospirota bacterium]
MRIFIIFSMVFSFLSGAGSVFASDAIETAGDAVALAAPATALVMTLTRSDREGAFQFLESYAVSSAVTIGLKYTVKERRPNGEKHSFPSFHTSSAFTAATFIRNRYGWRYGIPAYLAASFVGWSRIESKEHWTRDVLGGAAIGVASAFIFTKPYKGAVVTPVVGEHFLGFALSRRF